MSAFYFDRITCPYCHNQFSHKDVHFRMETFFEEEEDLNDEGMSLVQIKHMPDGPAKVRLAEQVNRNLPFLCASDERYERFWLDFDGTTETVDRGVERIFLGTLPPSCLPVLNPSDPDHRRVLKRQRTDTGAREDYFLCDNDGMVIGVEDIHGKRTNRRVCPHCHNPLPTGYGKHETKFISVIGITQSGKTVYLSQLLKYIHRYANMAGLTTYFHTANEVNFIESNPVKEGVCLPRPTAPRRLNQPLCADVVRTVGHKLEISTIVFYDIAGENCTNAASMARFGRFVTKSDGIIMLLDPSQLELVAPEKENAYGELSTILNAVCSAFADRRVDGRVEIPMAVCISKSDLIRDLLPAECRGDITPVRHPTTEEPEGKFNATGYNPLQAELTHQMRSGAGQMFHGMLRMNYKNFNYFAVSSLGCGVENRDGLSYPEASVKPVRIAEPLLWLFYKFGYIGSDVPIRLPVQREMPQTVTQTVKGPLPFMKKKVERPLTPEEQERYWYETRT